MSGQVGKRFTVKRKERSRRHRRAIAQPQTAETTGHNNARIFYTFSTMTDPDAIADCVLSTFDGLPDKRKPRPRNDGSREWVPLSGIVLVKGMVIIHYESTIGLLKEQRRWQSGMRFLRVRASLNHSIRSTLTIV